MYKYRRRKNNKNLLLYNAVLKLFPSKIKYNLIFKTNKRLKKHTCRIMKTLSTNIGNTQFTFITTNGNLIVVPMSDYYKHWKLYKSCTKNAK